MTGKTLPHNIEAEQSVLGAMFLSKYALQRAVETLVEEMFYVDAHGKIFNGIKSLADKNTPIDITTVTAELDNKKVLKHIGGVEYLSEIINVVPTAANIDYYIKIVEEKAIIRKLIEVATEIANISYNKEGSTNEILDEAEKKIFSVVKTRKTTEFKKIQEVLFKTQSDLEKLSQKQTEITGLATGFVDFDRLTTGLHENELIIVASRPAMGKTALALNIATFVAANSDKTVALFTLEMGAEQLAMRMISSLGQIEGNKLRTGKLYHNDWKKVNEAISQLADAKIYIDDTAGINVGEIRAKCRRLASSEEGLGLIIIDYLQLIQGTTRYAGNRQQEVSEISRALKTMAMELDVPVIALAQLSRAVEAREDKKPLMMDLRESGSIEQDADIVAFLYREDYYKKESRLDNNTSISELIIGKHRNGPTGTVELLFKRDTSTFLNYNKQPESENR
ncbi:MAG: replicative DNA helicase [Bacilli bacterium]|nr:replicative DNA helicase [Bacilli bacterium]